ncbi:MAG: SPOR domain-containing protein, partial [Candidatus Rokubacteria bacterium]|nr:SPOR domain-containing protein [Candidatus Rokubacteria bacterium]
SRVLYRVLALPGDGEGYGGLIQRLQGLGLAPELTNEGAAVTGLVPLRSAVETARGLREQGVRTRLEREGGAAAFRVVRVGGYATAAEAEQVRAELAARGLEGFVVRER